VPVNECDYQSYLLRIWRTGGKQTSEWRASLEEVSSGDIHSFASLEELFNFIRTQSNIASDLGLDPTER
jgi:hypothetical protein